jgi:hypothetical protein
LAPARGRSGNEIQEDVIRWRHAAFAARAGYTAGRLDRRDRTQKLHRLSNEPFAHLSGTT